MKKEYLTKSARATKTLAKKVAHSVLTGKKGPIVLALFGELGGGKTTFLQGFVKGLGIEERIQSPTFVIMKRYKIPNKIFKNFYHIDCYRIKSSKDFLNLEIEKILRDEKNIVAIEWADKIKKFLPKKAIQIEFKIKDKNKRKIILKQHER